MSSRIQLPSFVTGFTCGQMKGCPPHPPPPGSVCFFRHRKPFLEACPHTSSHVSFIRIGSQADAGVSPWPAGWSHLVGSHQTGFRSGAGTKVGIPRVTKSGESERGRCWVSGSTSSLSEKEFWWLLPLVCPFSECVFYVTPLS